jgi:enoyl-CoA hydratase
VLTAHHGTVVDTGSAQLKGELRGGVLTLTLNNEVKLNAITPNMLVALTRIATQLMDDTSVRVVTLTGAGARAFASGVDLGSMENSRAQSGSSKADAAYREALRAIAGLPQPVIAIIRGFCLGGGLALALCADMRICDDTAEFSIPAAKIGLGYPDVQPLMHAVGAGWAAEILFTGRRLSSSEALQAGLVNRVVAGPSLGGCANELCAMIASNAPLSVAAAKIALRELRKEASERNLDEVAHALAACTTSEDYLEGIRAIVEHRKPAFRGR